MRALGFVTVCIALVGIVSLAHGQNAQSPASSGTNQKHGPLHIVAKSADSSPISSASGASAPSCFDSRGRPGACLFNYFGGPLISDIDVLVVYWGSSISKAVDCGGGLDSKGNCIGISQFHSAVVNSTYIDMLGEYNTKGVQATAGSKTGLPGNQIIGRGTLHLGSPFIITPSLANSGTKISDSNIQNEIQSQIAAGKLPAPATDSLGNVNTIYMVYFPPGVTISDNGGSCVAGGFCAYHSTYLSSSNLAVPYGVIPDFGPGSGCDTGCGTGTEWQNITSASSHELGEAITDTAVGLATGTVPDFPLAWYDVNNGEIGDTCNQHTDALQFGATTFVVQQLFSQKAYNLNPNAGCVSPGTPTFTLTAPASSTPGSAFDVTVTANNGDGSTYLGTVQFTSSDGSASLPANYTFTSADANTHTFTGGVTLNANGADTITVSDAQQTANPGVATVNVGTHFVVSAPATATAGTAFNFTVTAKDASNNTVTGYTGTVHFTSSDPAAVLPANATLTSGTGTFPATLKMLGSQTITATDTVTTITGTSNAITVNAAAASSLTVAGFPNPSTAGVAGNFTVTAKDALNNIAAGYRGTVHFTSSDGQAALPLDYTFTAADNGVHTFSVALKTAGTQSLTGTDTVTATITGSQTGIAITPANASSFRVTAPGTATAGVTLSFTVTALDTFNNAATNYTGTVHLTSTDGQAVLPANYAFVGFDSGTHAFSATLKTGGNQRIVAIDTANATITGTSANILVSASAPANISATSGTPQNAVVHQPFAAPLQATAKDVFGNLVSGVTVTFTAPGTGASGTFANGTATTTATTNGSGVATATTFTASGTAGGPYTVTAAVAGVPTAANFSLTNTAGTAASITATAGTVQSATISTAFATALAATVKDSGGNPVSGVTVTFTAPGTGASGSFANGTATTTATTNGSGVATATTFTASGTAGGPYTVTAAVAGVATAVNFSLTNTAGTAASITATAGTPQSATISTAFATALAATVKDSGGNPVSGVTVTFTPPVSGASGTFAGGVNTATTNASGVATSAVFTANATAGGPYNVVASATGATSANFALTNKAGAAATVTATSGSGQSATIGTAFAAPLVGTVTDAGNNPVGGVVVTFTPPASGAGGTFAGGVNTATTNASGVATSAVFTANATAGGPYNVVASATGAASTNFSLTNNAGAAAKVAVTSGSGQSATISTAFAAPLVATVTDAGNNPVSGVVVTFTPPASGASGTFAGGANTATTNASGVATSATFTANATAGGPYNVVASATGATSANFSLTNKTGAAAKVAATSGSGQSAAINTAFAAPLVATVTDSGNNPVSGVVVMFTPPASGAGGTFAGGVNTATTNASGAATSAVYTANGTAGGPYNVVASATGATSANFALTNTSTPPGKVVTTTGAGQSAAINTAFGAPLVATVTDASNNPVSGVVVTFTPPASGASGTFAGSVNAATTNASGVATSAVFTANSMAGSYNVVASSPNDTSANFALMNTAGPAAKVTATSGTPQSAAINTAFAAPLVATVTDAGNNPLSGVVVTFTPPASGASGTFAGGVNTATTNASGVATAPVFTANGNVGPYLVAATVAGVAAPADFSLINNAGPAAGITATAGTPQNAAINTAFTTQLQATVKDSGNNLVSGAIVTFTAPASGASGTFAGGVNTATTNASGVATAPVFTANGTAGTYTVTAKAVGVAAPANFSLTNNSVQPTLASLLPASTLAGGASFSLTINGNNFVNGATVSFGTDAALVPTSTTATQILVTIPSADIAKAGQIVVTVTNPPPSGGQSLAQTFMVNNPVPTLTTLGQTHAAGGTAFTLTVNGANFVATSAVDFGTKVEPTTFVSATQVTAAIPASDVSSAGTVNVTVVNPTPGGGPTPTSIAFTVDGFSLAGPSSPVMVMAGQTASIPITITPSTNGFSNQVTFSVTGLPANASLVPLMVTPGNAKSTVNLMIMTTSSGGVPPASPMDQPPSPMLRLLLVLWIAALLAGLYAALLVRRTPRLRRYAATVPLALLLVIGAVLAGCASSMKGPPVGTSSLTITATSGSFSQSTSATLTEQ